MRLRLSGLARNHAIAESQNRRIAADCGAGVGGGGGLRPGRRMVRGARGDSWGLVRLCRRLRGNERFRLGGVPPAGPVRIPPRRPPGAFGADLPADAETRSPGSRLLQSSLAADERLRAVRAVRADGVVQAVRPARALTRPMEPRSLRRLPPRPLGCGRGDGGGCESGVSQVWAGCEPAAWCDSRE